MHEKSSQWKNQILNHSDVKLNKNVFKVCKSYRTTILAVFFHVLCHFFFKNVIKIVFPRSLWRVVRHYGGKLTTSAYLYKRTLSIRDMFHKIYNEKTETKEKIVMNEATDNDEKEVMLMKGVKSVINESNERKEAGELKKAYDRVEGIIERDVVNVVDVTGMTYKTDEIGDTEEMIETDEDELDGMNVPDETNKKGLDEMNEIDVIYVIDETDETDEMNRIDEIDEMDEMDVLDETNKKGFDEIDESDEINVTDETYEMNEIDKIEQILMIYEAFCLISLFIDFIDENITNRITNAKNVEPSSITNQITNSLCLSCPSIKMTICQTGFGYPLLWYPLLSNILQKCSLISMREKAKKLLPSREKKYSFIDLSFITLRSELKHRVKDYSKSSEKLNKSLIIIKGLTCRLLLKLAGDIESNPGPCVTLVTQNCRGLKKESKFRQLINRIYKSHNLNQSLIVALQETHIENSNLNYRWKGSHIFTPGNGHQGGCITLLSDNIEVLDQIDIENEAHVAKLNVVENTLSSTIIIANIHAPCAHNQIKLDFFEKLRENIDILQATEPLDCPIIILGDFNTVFNKNERINTNFTKKEKSIGDEINSIFETLQLTDCWDQGKNDMTWRHGDKMSKIDRIKWSPTLDYGEISTTTDWTYTESDHAAIIVNMSTPKSNLAARPVRIDTRFMQSTMLKHQFLKEIKVRMDQTTETNMNPHQKLEYLKMSIRSIALEIAANEKKRNELELQNLKKEIEFWQRAYENDSSSSYSTLIGTNLNQLIAKRDKMLNERGEYLSSRVKTQWYQEGEKSTKYFLNMQKARSRKTEMQELIENGEIVTDRDKIKELVEAFYKNLYERGDSVEYSEREISEYLSALDTVQTESIPELDKAITQDELLITLKSCTDSAPGPDGIPYSIIKLTWNYYGKCLIESWEYAQITGELTHSHQSSYLRLIPKEGKLHNNLKNWRPITLSNCDYKIITKTLAKKLTNAVTDLIGPTQTAYIPGRQITDNLHMLLHATEKSSSEDLESMLVSLDAEKAFDSVKHKYIRMILEKLGLNKFAMLFELMYKNQAVDIIINNEKAGSYLIKNGVKQGDALSCILFILCMEPLVRNLESDNGIDPIDAGIPKVVAYADDITCITKPTNGNLSLIFAHYNNLTKASGLKLNADKTEIISKGGQPNYNVNYQGQSFTITPKNKMKVNGLILSYCEDVVRTDNIAKMYEAIKSQLKQWSNRGLTLMGKIQIYKTFGLSQILYIGSVLMFNKETESKLNEIIYRFLWNRDFDKNKAPDRLKRSLLNKPVTELGFGMIDYRDVVRSLRIKTVIRLMGQSHPLGELLRSNTSTSWVNIATLRRTRPCLDLAVKDMEKMWKITFKNCSEEMREDIVNVVGHEYVGNILEKRFLNTRLARMHRHDTIKEIISISPTHPILKKLKKHIANVLCQSDLANITFKPVDNLLPIEMRLIPIKKLTSKLIRSGLTTREAITAKMLKGANESELKRLGKNIKGLTNIKLKSTMLRVIQGDVYCGSRLKKFGMTDTDGCPRCGQSEDIDHQLFSCHYTKILWSLVSGITGIPNNNLSNVLGISDFHDKSTLTLHAELIRILMAIDRPITPQTELVQQTLERLNILEKGVTKHQMNEMIKILTRNNGLVGMS